LGASQGSFFLIILFEEFFQGMAKNIYVGNLPWSVTEEDVRKAFAAYGEVQSVKFIEDRETGRFRGFGFVEMDGEGAEEAIQALDGSDFGGRAIKVNEAKPRVERTPRW
jgi:RNA recognition motif-containing protein